ITRSHRPRSRSPEAKMEKTFEENALPEEAPPVEAAPSGVSGVPAEPPAGAVQRLEQQLREAQDRHLRLAAEFDNFRKRVARERLELFDRAQAALVMKLTDILDDVDRIVASDPGTPLPNLLEAVLLVDKKLRKELDGAGAGSHRRRDLPGGLPLQGEPGSPGAGPGVLGRRARVSGREGLLPGAGGLREGHRRGDQEGLPPARQAVPSRRQPE